MAAGTVVAHDVGKTVAKTRLATLLASLLAIVSMGVFFVFGWKRHWP